MLFQPVVDAQAAPALHGVTGFDGVKGGAKFSTTSALTADAHLALTMPYSYYAIKRAVLFTMIAIGAINLDCIKPPSRHKSDCPATKTEPTSSS